MKVSEDKLRDYAIEAFKNLGQNATPESVKKYIEQKISSTETNFEPKNESKSAGRIILTSFGLNHPGIVSGVSSALSACGCDILDLTQKLMQEFFTMIMIIDISNSSKELKELQEELNKLAEQLKVKIYLQHEDVFRYMHRI